MFFGLAEGRPPSTMKNVFLRKGCILVFAHPYSVLTRFWGSGIPGGHQKNEKKQLVEKHGFLVDTELGKNAPSF